MWSRGLLIAGVAVAQLGACGGEVARGDASEGSGGTTATAAGSAESGQFGGTTATSAQPAAGGASHAGAAATSSSMSGGAGSSPVVDVGGGGGALPGSCWLTLPGATGEEPGGVIPVCCIPSAEQRERRDTLLQALDDYRAEAGLPGLQSDPAIQAAAQGYARHMDEHPFFDSTAPEDVVGTVWEAAALCGTHVTAANLAANLGGPLDVLRTWMEIPGTNQWLVDPDFVRVGLGTHGYHWCLLLD